MPLALTWYDWFKTLHVLAAVLWVGGGTTLAVYAILTQRQNTPEEMASVARKAALDRRAHVHSVVAAGARIRLRTDGERPERVDVRPVLRDFRARGVGRLGGHGALLPRAEANKLGKLMPTRAADDPEVQARIHRILLIARIDVLLLLAIVFVMTAKPFL